ncbi:unnamed protein product [Symbiodinium microadriaticum]|nr:unnamed protein product [Symbiodinium microadriaticum]
MGDASEGKEQQLNQEEEEVLAREDEGLGAQSPKHRRAPQSTAEHRRAHAEAQHAISQASQRPKQRCWQTCQSMLAVLSRRVEEAVAREAVAVEKLKAAKLAKAEAAAETHKASAGRGDIEKTVKILELHMEGNQKVQELQQAKKSAAEAAEAAKKAAEEAKKKEKELLEALVP